MEIAKRNCETGKPNQKRVREKFTIEEDNYLRMLYEHFGNNWNAIAKQMRTKNPRQCRDRWMLYLTPDRNNKPFSLQEIMKLKDMVAKYGHKWRVISSCFDRTEVQIKNMWKVLQRKKEFKEEVTQVVSSPEVLLQSSTDEKTETTKIPSFLDPDFHVSLLNHQVSSDTKEYTEKKRIVLPNLTSIIMPGNDIDSFLQLIKQ